MMDRILVGLDGSDLAETVLPVACLLAQQGTAEMVLLHVASFPGDFQVDWRHFTLRHLTKLAEHQWKDYLEKVRQELVGADVKAETAVAVGAAAKEIVRYADQVGMNLIALATHGRSGLPRWLAGSVAEEVLNSTHTPLLLVRSSEEQPPHPPAVRRIILPLDGSLLAEGALPFAEVLAGRLTIPVTLLRVVETVTLPGILVPSAEAQAHEKALRESVESYLRRVAAELRESEIHCEMAVLLGPPASQIIDYVGTRPDSLVVMATRGRSGFAGLGLGSVARRVVQETRVPVLLVRPPSLLFP